MKKTYKIGAYALILIFIIFLSVFIFNTAASIFKTFESTQEFSQISSSIQNLYLQIILALAVPFIFILVLLFLHFFNSSVEIEIENSALETSREDKEKEEEKQQKSDEDRIKAEKAEREKFYKEQKAKLKECFKENLSKKITDHKIVSKKILSCLSNFYEIVQAEVYLSEKKDKKNILKLSETYAFFIPEEKLFEFEIGEGLIGQVAKERACLNLTDVPEGYIKVASGLGSSTPSNLIIVPMINNKEELVGVFEMASFKSFTEDDNVLLEDIGTFICQFYSQTDK